MSLGHFRIMGEFQHKSSLKLGNGDHTSFWEDRWLGAGNLKDDFPLPKIRNLLFSSIGKTTPGPHSSEASSKTGSWMTYRDCLQDYQILKSTPVYKANWNVENFFKKKAYTVRRKYDNLCFNKELIDKWQWKHKWKTKLPPKIVCFVWTTLYEACLTQDNLSKRKIQVVNECYTCHQTMLESVTHLFLDYAF